VKYAQVQVLIYLGAFLNKAGKLFIILSVRSSRIGGWFITQAEMVLKSARIGIKELKNGQL